MYLFVLSCGGTSCSNFREQRTGPYIICDFNLIVCLFLWLKSQHTAQPSFKYWNNWSCQFDQMQEFLVNSIPQWAFRSPEWDNWKGNIFHDWCSTLYKLVLVNIRSLNMWKPQTSCFGENLTCNLLKLMQLYKQSNIFLYEMSIERKIKPEFLS